jgi:WG containing repeat
MMYRFVLALSALFLIENAFCQDNGPLIPFRDGNLWGYSDTLANIKFQPVYDSVGFMLNYGHNASACARVIKNGKHGMLNEALIEIIPAKYDKIRLNNLVEVQKDGKWGILSYTGNEILPTLYDSILALHYINCVIASKNGKFGVLSMENKQIAAFRYEFIIHVEIPGKEAYFIAKNKGAFTCFTKDGQVIHPNAQEVERLARRYENGDGVSEAMGRDDIRRMPIEKTLVEDYLPPSKAATEGYDKVVCLGKDCSFMKAVKNDRVGLLNSQGQLIVEPIYKRLVLSYAHSNPPISCTSRKTSAIFFLEQNGKLVCVGSNGEKLLNFDLSYVKLIPIREAGFYSFCGTSEDYFLLENGQKQGAWLLNTSYPPTQIAYEQIKYCRYLSVNNYLCFEIFEVIKDGKFGYVGENGVEYFRN